MRRPVYAICQQEIPRPVCTSYSINPRIQNVLSQGVEIFLVDEGIEDLNTTINGPSSAR